MKIDNTLIDSLLYGEEGVDLDFKRDQYKFAKTSDNEKSELLKDILAFANAWRRSNAFILVGINEIKGGRSEVVGVQEKLDDAKIQQFVNSKTQKPITFSYSNVEFEGKDICIIHIPIQRRPFYIIKDFGKLRKQTVYIRRGSSTDIAKIDEIAKMGASPLDFNENQPLLELFYADKENRNILHDNLSISSLVLHPPENKDIPDYKGRPSRPSWGLNMGLDSPNYDYYRKLTNFTTWFALLTPINLAIENSGPLVANDVRLEIEIADPQKVIRAIDEDEYPDVPKRSYSSAFDAVNRQVQNVGITHDLTVKHLPELWFVEANVEKVQPKSIAWIESSLFLGVVESVNILLKTTLFADNLSDPIKKEFIIKAEAVHRKVSLDDIIEIEKERFKNSPEFQKFMEMHSNKEEG